MIYDCFTFYNEIEILKARLNYLDKYVDKFIISEATKTHSGFQKELVLKKHWSKFKKYHHKIDYLIIDDFPEYKTSWTYENFQRNKIHDKLVNCDDNDIIMISDVDEIPNALKIPKNIKEKEIYLFVQKFYLFFINTYPENQIFWIGGSKIFKYKTLKLNLLNEKYVKYDNTSFPKYLNQGATLTKIRLYRNTKLIFEGGWHFSWLGGVKNIKKKLVSFSHQEISFSKRNEKYILECLNKGVDVLDPSRSIFIDKNLNIPGEFLIYKNLKLKSGISQRKIRYLYEYYKELLIIRLRFVIRPIYNYFL